MSKAKGKMGAKAKAGRKQTDGNSRKFPGRKKSKSKKEKKGNQTDAPSMVQLPSLGDQAARQQELAKSYAEQVQRARDTAGGSSGLAGVTTAAMKIFDGKCSSSKCSAALAKVACSKTGVQELSD
ncbi:hypothetical protein, conserved [Eimeria tenella]|uniref:Uncharacterized protein n=1 Tax=Eimeria tenella TaxID=5802 RepID=U6KUX3_EIMTE|nr:hypothetical protein, conserved [Eimeria tenella]CDJ40728.1 hypothetical protein, conserved [Eimeria tenella]|eukprot:XP_013231478.1 hypothetical protein, conserved [Eimeria tenella]